MPGLRRPLAQCGTPVTRTAAASDGPLHVSTCPPCPLTPILCFYLPAEGTCLCVVDTIQLAAV